MVVFGWSGVKHSSVILIFWSHLCPYSSTEFYKRVLDFLNFFTGLQPCNSSCILILLWPSQHFVTMFIVSLPKKSPPKTTNLKMLLFEGDFAVILKKTLQCCKLCQQSQQSIQADSSPLNQTCSAFHLSRLFWCEQLSFGDIGHTLYILKVYFTLKKQETDNLRINKLSRPSNLRCMS